MYINLLKIVLKKRHLNFIEVIYWVIKFKRVVTQEAYHWDYAVQLNMWIKDLYAIIPATNLVQNIGADDRSLNTKSKTSNHFLSIAVKSYDVEKLFNVPNMAEYNTMHDKADQKIVFGSNLKFVKRLIGKVLQTLGFR